MRIRFDMQNHGGVVHNGWVGVYNEAGYFNRIVNVQSETQYHQ